MLSLQKINSLISNCNNWQQLSSLIERQKNTVDMGDIFERFTQLFLQTNSVYSSKIEKVWWPKHDQLPKGLLDKLNLPTEDEGIDLICKTKDGEYWSVQSKYRKNIDQAFTTKELSKFVSLSFVTGKNITKGLFAHTSSKPIKKHDLMGNTTELGLQLWLNISDEEWKRIQSLCSSDKLMPPKRRKPLPHQQSVIKDAKDHFIKNNNSKGRLIMPCGTGKSLAAFWINNELKPETTIVAVPSLALIKQSLEDWTNEFLANKTIPEWITVCSDDSVGNLDTDSTISSVYESGIPATTDKKEISGFFKKKVKVPKIIFTTYQSSNLLANVCKKLKLSIDFCILDEAHKTVGRSDKLFSTLLFEKNINIKKRLFMTATERVYRGSSDDVVSMDDKNIYGKCFHQLTFKKAIEEKIICDYKILTVSVSDNEISELISDNTDINTNLGNKKVETDSRSLAAGVALGKVFEKYKINHAVSFHSSIKRANDFSQQQNEIGKVWKQLQNINNSHVSSKKSAGERAKLLKNFETDKKALITNARCLTEGVDIPSIDCVLFADPRQSVVDIVQAAGRAMRQSAITNKKFGYILLPLVVPKDMNLEEFSNSTNFKSITKVITALSTQDERIAEEFRNQFQRKYDDNKIIDISIGVKNSFNIDFKKFHEKLYSKIWENVGKANWRSFLEARDFVHKLNLKNISQWQKYAKSEKKPNDIPSTPKEIYKNQGWISVGDWLGTRNIANKYRSFKSFEDARAFARNLNLKNSKDWINFSKLGKLPEDIPSNPQKNYPEDWISMGDWLGTGVVAPQLKVYRDFKKARIFARNLNLKSSKEWIKYIKLNPSLIDLPTYPNNVYKDKGWISWNDWLKTSFASRNQVYKSFKEARNYARSLNFKNVDQWKKFIVSGMLPEDIPKDPRTKYKNHGWVSMGDWLGTGTVATFLIKYRDFKKARIFARSLKLKSGSQWLDYTKSDIFPKDIPKTPRIAYRNKGWISMGDWLGTGRVADQLKEFCTYGEARKYVKDLKFKTNIEWREFSKSSKKPSQIPSSPDKVYKNKGWTSWSDFLGSKNISRQKIVYRNFKEAREFARSLKLHSWTEWYASNKPDDIPTNPSKHYKSKGWISMGDWLGTKVILPKSRTFKNFNDARIFARKLKINSQSEWYKFAKSGNRPLDIPMDPRQKYINTGWISWGDFLGTKNNSPSQKP